MLVDMSRELKLFVSFRDFFPVDYLPKGVNIVGAFVLIFEVVCMLPNIHSKNWGPSLLGNIH